LMMIAYDFQSAFLLFPSFLGSYVAKNESIDLRERKYRLLFEVVFQQLGAFMIGSLG